MYQIKGTTTPISLAELRALHPLVSFPDVGPDDAMLESLGLGRYIAPPLTLAQRVAALTAVVQAHLDGVAQAWGYDSILSLVSYRDDTAPRFVAEGQAAYAWRSAVWVACIGILDDYQAGHRVEPSPAELIAELPGITRP